jgi:multidrug efflux pump subunit AcrB
MSAPPGYNLATMEEIGTKIEQYLLPHVAADGASFDSGASPVPPMRYVSLRVGTDRVRVITEPARTRDVDDLMRAITDKMREYPGMRAFAARGSIISSNNGGTRSINLDIAGPELSDIYQVARLAEDRAREVLEAPRIQSQPSSLSLAQPLIRIIPRWERASELGLSAQALGFTVSALTDGSYVDEFFLGDDKIDIFLYSADGLNADLDQLAQAPLYSATGEVVQLGAVVRFEETVDTAAIRRVGGRRTVTLNVIPPRDIALESGVALIRQEVVQYLRARGDIPSNIDIQISGAADQLDATRNSLFANYLVALFIVYLLMVAIFRHWGYPLLIITSIPLGIAGGIAGLAILNGVGALLPHIGLAEVVQPFDMISMLGFLILMGTVVNNPILVVYQAVDNYRQNPQAVAAVSQALRDRLRPIIMTTITTICGLAPLVLIPGAGTELYRGVGAIVLFGILGAMLVTLTLLPALTVITLEWQAKLAGRDVPNEGLHSL